MRIIRVTGEKKVSDLEFTTKDAIVEVHRIADRYLGAAHDGLEHPTDMDGVSIQDDLAMHAADVAYPDGSNFFGKVADLNIAAVDRGELVYCWNGPTAFVGYLLKGLSPEINRVIGKHMRLIPGERFYAQAIQELGYNMTFVTAGHQEGAEQVGKRLGINNVIGTQLGVTNDVYDGSVERFIGGKWKLAQVQKILGEPARGVHLGDSWSDVQTLEGVTNSIAFNPGCHYALQHARISVISPTKMSVLPFFDAQGKYDAKIGSDVLAGTTIIINDSNHPVIGNAFLEKLLGESKGMKDHIGEILNQEDRNYNRAPVLSRIIEELDTKGILYASHVKRLPTPDAFHQEALQMYKDTEHKVAASHR